MKNLSLKLALLLPFVILLLSLTAEAQSKKISMQGFLKDANGKAVADGNKVLTFKIYDASSGGSAIWTKTFSQVNVVGGVYAVQLGPSDGSIEISTLLWDVPYFVGITVESEPELTPRTEFTYAPYTFAVNKANFADEATYAVTAGAIGGDLDLASGGFTADMRILRNSKITGSNPDNNILIGQGSGASSSLKLYSNDLETMVVNGSSVKINGTTNFSEFNQGTDEHTYINGGKGTSNVYLNSTPGGSVIAGGNLSAGSIFTTGSLYAGTLSAGSISTTGSLNAGTLSAGSISTTGSLNAGTLSAGSISTTGSVSAFSITSISELNAGSIVSFGPLRASAISSSGNTTVEGSLSAGSISTTGFVNINGGNGQAPLHIGNTRYGSPTAAAPYTYWKHSSVGLTSEIGIISHAVVKADGWIWSTSGFYSSSDKRIKNIIGISKSSEDLDKLNKIEITDYKYKDEILNKPGLQKKVIAQQVQEFFPMAINTSKGIIPSVFAVAKNSKINGQSTIISTSEAHDFKTGDLVKLVLEKGGEKELKVEVIDETTFSVAEPITDKIFVYGKHVDDFLTVDYDAIAMLNVSATQELSKQIELLKAENAKLKTENSNYESRLTKIEALLNVGQAVPTGK
jgi:hypothetical protein